MIRSILKVSYPNFMTLNKYWKRNTKLSDASIVITCNERITNNHVEVIPVNWTQKFEPHGGQISKP